MDQIYPGKQMAYAPLDDRAVTEQPIALQSTTTSTTVVVSQPTMQQNMWRSGVCDCCMDMKSCCCAFFVGNCYFACLASRMGENCCVGLGCVPGGHLAMRVAFRREHGIPGSICDDACTMTCCLPCAMCQLAREMNYYQYPPKDCCC